ncbi:Ltp family lipoprotein [Myceligenerans indicum]|uniref:Ltp family lipoprotein n=1 Tax=Myceligenerans indicum TaxID=2593663 RepID=UPI00191F4109|nr:Ltp family lipoprotein [Myceligenerans indicum]
MGIFAVFLSLLFIPAIVGLILGIIGVVKAGRTSLPVGKGQAIAGIALSSFALVLGIGLVTLIGAISDDAGDPAQGAAVQEELRQEAEETTESDGDADAGVGTESQDEEKADPADDPAERAPFQEDPVEEASDESVSQANARRSAERYLDYTAFSKSGLMEQLEFEGFSTADAKYAVGNIEVDWMEQAEKSAENYMDYSPFSRAGLIDQLEYEGFTPEQAAHGADSVGL